MNANATPLAVPKPDLSKTTTLLRSSTAGAIRESSPLFIPLSDPTVASGTQGVSGYQPHLPRMYPPRSDNAGDVRRPQATARRQRRDVLGSEQLAAALPTLQQHEDWPGDPSLREVTNQARRRSHG